MTERAGRTDATILPTLKRCDETLGAN